MKDFLSCGEVAFLPLSGERANPFSKNSTSQSTTNQQVGVQGGVGISGTQFTTNQGGDITFINSDAETVQKALETTGAVAYNAVQGANQTSIYALQALTENQAAANSVIGDAVAAAQQIALTATPQSEGQTIRDIAAQNTKVFVVVGVVAAVAFFSLRK